jgi:hypothetical protein
MKKLLLSAYIICNIFGAKAQIQFGIKAGYNLSSIITSGDNINTQQAKSGFNAGIFSFIHLFNSFSLQPEISYSNQGSKSNDSVAKTNYNYVNVPVLFKYEHHSGIFLETGPQIGFLLNSEYKSNTYTQDLKSVSKSTDFSWVFGAGYKLSAIPLGIDVRYNYGLTNITTYTIITAKNSVLQIDLFYVFKK